MPQVRDSRGCARRRRIACIECMKGTLDLLAAEAARDCHNPRASILVRPSIQMSGRMDEMLDAVHKHPAGYPRHVQQSLQPQHAIGRAVPPASASVREGCGYASMTLLLEQAPAAPFLTSRDRSLRSMLLRNSVSGPSTSSEALKRAILDAGDTSPVAARHTACRDCRACAERSPNVRESAVGR